MEINERNSYIRENYTKMTSKVIAKKLGVCEKTVTTTLNKLGLRRSLEYTEIEGEEWLECSFTSDYLISDLGRVFSVEKNCLLRQETNNCGYKRFNVTNEKDKTKRRHIYVHREIGLTFLKESYKPGLEMNHIDGVKIHNTKENLEWITPSLNTKKAHDMGLVASKKGIRNSSGIKHPIEKIHEIKKLIKLKVPDAEISKKVKISRSYIAERRRGEKHLNT